MRLFARACSRVLLTEVAGHSTGDQALCVAAVRRLLQARCDVKVLQRTDRGPVFKAAGLGRVPLANFLIPPDRLAVCESPAAIVDAVAREYPSLFKQAQQLLAEADVVMTAPGGRMMDGYAVPRNLAVSFMAIQRGIPVINLHQSVGPVSSEPWRRLLHEWAQHSMLTVVRDEKSMEFVRALGVEETRLFESRDLLFAEDVPTLGGAEFALGINLRFGGGGHSTPEAVCSFLKRWRGEASSGARVMMYTTTYDIPREIAAQLRPHVDVLEPQVLSPLDNTWATLARCRIHITDSFHGAVLAWMAGCPVVPLQPDHASWKLHGTTAPGIQRIRPLPGLIAEQDIHDLVDAVRDVHEHAEEHRFRAMALARYGRERAEAGWRRVMQAIGRK